jgi:hypothetical protein
VGTEDPNNSGYKSTFDSEIANVMAQRKDAEINVDTVNTTLEDRGRPRYRKKTHKFQLAKDTVSFLHPRDFILFLFLCITRCPTPPMRQSQSLHDMPPNRSSKETAHVHN